MADPRLVKLHNGTNEVGTESNPLVATAGTEYEDNQSGITTPKGQGLAWFDDAGNAYAVKDTNPLPVYLPTGISNYIVPLGDSISESNPAHVNITDGTTKATVRELGTNDALNTALCDDTGAQMGTTSNPIANTLFDMALTLKRLFYSMACPGWLNRAANRLMCQSTIESGTVTTVTTVTTLTNMGSSTADVMQRNLSAITWAQNVRSRIT